MNKQINYQNLLNLLSQQIIQNPYYIYKNLSHKDIKIHQLKEMNLQTYQLCISSLEKEIKSRQQQRQQMAHTIESLDDQLQRQISRNKQLKQDMKQVMRNNQELLMQLHEKQTLIQERQQMINESLTADNFIKQKVTMLETQKKYLQQQLKDRDQLIEGKTQSITQLQLQLKKNTSLIQGYRNIVNEKAKIIAQLQTKIQLSQLQKQKLSKQIIKIKQHHDAQRQEMQYKLQHQSVRASDSVEELQNKLLVIKKQLTQTKQLHNNQINTLQFNYSQQIKQLQKQEAFLKNQIIHYLQVIEELKQQQKKNKLQYEKSTINNDQVVNQLINEINFLKQQKVSTQKKKSLQLDDVTKQMIQIGLEKVVHEQQLKQLHEKINEKQQLVKQLQIKSQQLNIQNVQYQQQLTKQKNDNFLKGQQIHQLKLQIDKTNKHLQAARKQKQSANNNTSVQLAMLRQQNIDLQRTLLNTQSQLQQQKIKYIELQQTIKQYNYQKVNQQQSQSQLLIVITTHQSTIHQLQSLLQQSRKVINELNHTLKVKLTEIQALQNSNHLFRKQKLQWIQKEDQYRKKIIEYKNNKSTQRQKSNRVNTTMTNNDYSTYKIRSYNRALTETYKPSAQSVIIGNSPSGQLNLNLSSSSLVNNGNSKLRSVTTPINWLDRLNNTDEPPYFVNPNNNGSRSSSENQEIPFDIQDTHINSQSYRESKNVKIKTSQSHQVNQVTQRHHAMKKKAHFNVENGTNISNGLKKDYSVGKINTLKQRQ